MLKMLKMCVNFSRKSSLLSWKELHHHQALKDNYLFSLIIIMFYNIMIDTFQIFLKNISLSPIKIMMNHVSIHIFELVYC